MRILFKSTPQRRSRALSSTFGSGLRAGFSVVAAGLLTGAVQAAAPASALAAGAAGVPAPASTTPTVPSGCTKGDVWVSCRYDFDSGNEHRFTVPGGVKRLDLTVDGGGGGRGALTSADGVGGAGGRARTVAGAFYVSPGDVVRYVVGGSGGDAPNTRDCGGNGGLGLAGYLGGEGGRYQETPLDEHGNCAGNDDGYGGGGGGGATVVSLNGPISSPAVVAGGGGGGGGQDIEWDAGGAGGGTGGSWDGQAGAGSGAGAGGTAGGGSSSGGQTDDNYYTGAGGGGGGGFPRAGNGGQGMQSTNGLVGSGGGGGAGDSWDGGAANTPSGTVLHAATMGLSGRDSAANGLLTITYRAPVVNLFTSVTPASTYYGNRVTYSTTVESFSGVSVPSGTVTFSIPEKVLCQAVPLVQAPDSDIQSVATCTTTETPVGAHQVTTAYSGDAAFWPQVTSDPRDTVTVDAIPTSTYISGMPTAPRSTTAVYTAWVLPQRWIRLQPAAGTVAFYYGGGWLACTARVVNYTASCTGERSGAARAVYEPPDPGAADYYGYAGSTSAYIDIVG